MSVTHDRASAKRPLKTLNQLRERKGLTQDQLAAKVGVTRVYITQLETGARANPSIPVLKRLAQALGVALDDLV